MGQQEMLEAFYADAGGDFGAVLTRLRDPKRVERFVRLFGSDDTYRNLVAAVAAGDVETAFRASHTLKGTTRDVGLTELSTTASEVCEALRGGDLAAGAALMPPVEEAYARYAEAAARHLS